MGLLERGAGIVYRRWLASDNRLTRALIDRYADIGRPAFRATLIVYPLFATASWIIILSRRALGLKPRVVWGPTPILTIADSSELLHRLGYPSTTVVYSTYHIRSGFDVNLQEAIENPAVTPWLPSVLHLWSLLKFDVFHFFYDGGLWSGMNVVPSARWLELPLLRLAGKRVIASAYGADVRVRHLNELWQPYNICRECPQPGAFCVCGPEGLTRAKYHRDWCNVILTMGAAREWVFDSRTDLNYWPIDLEKVTFVGAEPRPGPVRIVHAPNHRYFKGTRFVERAVASLRERGHEVELDLVEGVSHEEARRRYEAADIVFAQCLAGSMGYTEIEAMAAGKPVLGYIRNPSYYEHTSGTPLVSATPATLERELEKLVADGALRAEIGRRGRRYVERAWSYDALAPAYDELHREVWEHNDVLRTLRRKLSDFVRGESAYRVGRPLEGSALREWPVWSAPRLNIRRIEAGIFGQPPFDDAGMPRVADGGRYVEHPGVVALYALHAFHLHLGVPTVEEHRARFLRAARWLQDRLDVDHDGIGRWYHRFARAGRPGDVPWVSSSAQGLGLSILLRADQAQPAEGFGEAAATAARLFQVSVLDGGLLSERDGLTYLAEHPDADPADELSGFVTGVFGLHEYHRVGGEPWVAELFVRCATTLARLRERLVDGAGHVLTVTADPEYFVVQQLHALHRMTGEPEFRSRARERSRLVRASRLRAFVRHEAPV